MALRFLFLLLFSFCVAPAFAGDHHPRAKTAPSLPEDRCDQYRRSLPWAPPELGLPPGGGPDEAPPPKKNPKRMEGHSPRGEGFDGGPRKLAGLRSGLPKLDFPISTKNPEAQKFFAQGIAQLHGYQFLEAERSFRKVIELDPNAAMAYWGMSLAAINSMQILPNARARKLIALAQKQKTAQLAAKNLTPKEAAYIDALGKLASPDFQQAPLDYISAMKKIADGDRKDAEAQAFYAHALMLTLPDANEPNSLKAAEEADAVLQRVFDQDPHHPAHHYRIHVWDGRDSKRSAASAIEVGPSAPGIAHMWHMPTHHYSRTKQDREAAWHEEAALRADNAYMQEAGVMPSEIHNFTHNATMLTDHLWALGQGSRALDVSQNFLRMPADPNAPGSFGSSPVEQAEDELLSNIDNAEMWEEMSGLRNSALFSLKNPMHEARLVSYLARAAVGTQDRKLFADQVAAVACLRQLADKSEYEPAKFSVGVAALELDFLKAKVDGDKGAMKKAFFALLKFAEFPNGDGSKGYGLSIYSLARYAIEAGEGDSALALLEPYAKYPAGFTFLSTYAEALHAAGKNERATRVLQEMAKAFGRPDFRDKNRGPQKRIAALEKRYGVANPDKPLWNDDKHPALSTLGPIAWKPQAAPPFAATTADGKPYTLPAKKPVALVFNLGMGCVHCNEQVRKLATEVDDMRKAGLEVVVVTNESPEQLTKSLADYKTAGVRIDFPMVSDRDGTAFQKFGVYDETDRQPLHGLFLLDAEGKVRWRDISPDPYLPFAYFRGEATRMLKSSSGVQR